MPHAFFVPTDDRYAPYAELLLKSLDRSYPDHPDVLLIGVDLSETWKTRLLQYINTRFVALPEAARLTGPLVKNDSRTNAEAMYAEMFLWQHGFPEYDRIAALDADMLVLGPLDALWEGDTVAVIEDVYRGRQVIFWNPDDPAVQALLTADRIMSPQRLANCGMIVVPKHLRTPNEYAKIRNLIDRYGPHVIWGEQSILNLWMAGHGIEPIPDRTLNFQERFFLRHLLTDRKQIRILHMNSLPHGRTRLFLLRCAYHLLPSLSGTVLYLMIHLAVTPWVKVGWKIAKISRRLRS